MVALRINSPLLVEFINEKAGEEGYQLVKTLSVCNRGCTDEEISAETGVKVNTLRSLLNKLHYIGVINYTKIKAENSNWYTYTWYLEKERIIELLRDKYAEELEKLNQKKEYESNYVFFKCETECERLPFELAFEYDFKCPHCGKLMSQENNKTKVKKIHEKIKEIDLFLKETNKTNKSKTKTEKKVVKKVIKKVSAKKSSAKPKAKKTTKKKLKKK